MSLSYDAVAEAVRELEASGKPLGARVLYDILKTGSLTTIQKHLLRWREERSRLVPPDLPESLHRVLLDFAAREVQKGQTRLEGLLTESRNALLEAILTGEEQDRLLESLREELSEREERIRTLSDQVRHLEMRVTECQEREARERDEAHTLRKALVRADLRLEELPRLREETNTLRTKLVEEKEARVAPEKESAVSRALLAEKTATRKPPGRA